MLRDISDSCDLSLMQGFAKPNLGISNIYNEGK